MLRIWTISLLLIVGVFPSAPAFDSPAACLDATLLALQNQDQPRLESCFASPVSQTYLAPLYLRIYRFQEAQRIATARFDFAAVEDGFRTAPALYRFLEGAPDWARLASEHSSRQHKDKIVLEHRRSLPDERVRVSRLRLRSTANGWLIDGPNEKTSALQNWFEQYSKAIDLVLPGLEAAVQTATSRDQLVTLVQDAARPAGAFMQQFQADLQKKAREHKHAQEKNSCWLLLTANSQPRPTYRARRGAGLA